MCHECGRPCGDGGRSAGGVELSQAGHGGGGLREKVLRMDELPVEEESHGAAEALLVLDGRLELEVDGMPVSVRAGELFMVAAGTAHAVRSGSRGTLVIVELTEE